MKRDYNFYVYIMASSSGTLYIGFTKSLIKRVDEHKNNKVDGFTKRYACHKLVYYEHYKDVYFGLKREKELKKWNRMKKQDLIKNINPHWNDLYHELLK